MNRERQVDQEFENLWKRLRALELRVTYLEDSGAKLGPSMFQEVQQLSPETVKSYLDKVEKI
jgi:hypothetical protein